MINVWDDMEGPEYAYLGHFQNSANLCRGHNTSYAPEPPSVQGLESSVLQTGAGTSHATTPASTKPPGGGAGKSIAKSLLGAIIGGPGLDYGSDVGADFGGGGDFEGGGF